MTVSQNRLVVGYDNSAFQPLSYTAHDAVTRQLTPADTLGKARQRGEGDARALDQRWKIDAVRGRAGPAAATGGRHAARTMSAYSFYSVQIQRTDDRTEPFACVP